MRRQFEDNLAVVLQGATLLAFAVACLGLFLPGEAGDGFGVAMVVLLVATPLARVLMLVGHWRGERDMRFVTAGVGLVVLVGLGALLAALR